jgi:hypothetical protein
MRLSAGEQYRAPRAPTAPEEEPALLRRAFTRAPGRLHETPTDHLASADAAWYRKTATYQLLKRARERVESQLATRGIRQDQAGSIYTVWREHRRSASRIKDELPDLSSALQVYARDLNLIVDFVQAAGAQPVLMTQPALWRPGLEPEGEGRLWLGGEGRFQIERGNAYYSVDALARAKAAYNARLLEVCAERRIFCIDLARRLPSSLDIFYDDVHYTRKGARHVADIVTESLATLLHPEITLAAGSL